ncbi:MAG: thioredoxin family protein [Methylocystis sp.]|nr:thioredoxin family protein [Methylocystis sp.]
MLDRRALLTLFLLAGVFTNIRADAAERMQFTPAAFAAAKKAGKSILVDISASWCSTCQAQEVALRRLANDPKFKTLTIFEVDFDAQKEAVRSFNARWQSTLIVFKGEREMGRSLADTDPASIATLLEAAF